jgi:hypothetical protein
MACSRIWRVDEKGLAGSIQDDRSEEDLCFLWLDAEDNEVLASEPYAEALVVKQVLLVRETDALIPPIGHPLPGSLSKQVRQVTLDCLQGLLLRINWS